MNHRYEDAIIQFAFGELDGAEAEHIRQLVEKDPKAREIYLQCSDLKCGLGRMKTPEHQLSNERLMQAILSDDLTRKRKSPGVRGLGLSWLVPVGAFGLVAALAVSLPLLRTTPTQAPVDSAATVASTQASPVPELAPPSPEATPALPLVVEEEAPRVAVQRVQTRQRVRTKRNRSEEEVAARANAMVAVMSLPVEQAPPPLTTPDLTSRVIEAAAPDEPEADQTLIFIGADQDENTGATRAVEVTSTRDVVVGG